MPERTTGFHRPIAEVGSLCTKRPLRATRPSWSSRSKVCVRLVNVFSLTERNKSRVSCPSASGPDSVDRRSVQGQTPLFLAVERGLVDNASFLLTHGAHADSQDHDQDSPLVVGTLNMSLGVFHSVAWRNMGSGFIVSVCSHPLRPHGPGEAAAPARLRGEPGGLLRPPAPS